MHEHTPLLKKKKKLLNTSLCSVVSSAFKVKIHVRKEHLAVPSPHSFLAVYRKCIPLILRKKSLEHRKGSR